MRNSTRQAPVQTSLFQFMAKEVKKKCQIWTIGGGKGGIGKSFLISSIACCLAGKQQRVVLVDLDLGGANLHTFLGIQRPKATLTDFFDKKAPLASLVVETGIPNLSLLTGMVNSLAPDSIKHTQKARLFKQIRELDADYILIDLGAGTHFHTIDAYLLGDKMMAVIVPEMISLENMYYFIKNVFFRKLINALTEAGLKDLVASTWKDRDKYHIENINQLTDHLKGISPAVATVVERELAEFTFDLLLNMVRNDQDITVGMSAKSVCLQYFGFRARYAGYVEYDEVVSRCINRRLPYLQTHPTSKTAKNLATLTVTLQENRQVTAT